MGNFYFERECRTPYSECYNIFEDDTAVGRVDIHYTNTMVHATLSVSESLTTEAIQDLIDTIDEEIVDSVGVNRQEFIVHVHQGRDVGVFSGHAFEENDGQSLS